MRQLKDGVEGIQDSSQFRLFLTTMSKFHEYSVGNLILIAIQKPSATRVAGFNTWKDLGRWVKKGEKGIAILAPVMPPKPKKEEVEEEEEEELALTPVYFKVVHVFDIRQTEGKPLPEFDVPVLTGDANEALFEKAMNLAKSQGLDVSFELRPNQDPSIKGQFSGRSIWVKPDEPRAQQLKSLLHEMAHYYSEGVFRIPRRDAETIAESAAFAVGAHYGFDSGVRSFPYVALWAQDKKVLQANLTNIRKVTNVILERLEKEQGVISPQTKYWVRIKDPGSTSLTPGSIIPYEKFERENKMAIERKGKTASIETRYRYGSGNGQPYQPQTQFIRVGDRVKYIGSSKYRYEGWPEGAWLQFGSQGTVIEYFPELPALPSMNIESIPAYAVVSWDNRGQTAIDAEYEGKDWERIGNIEFLARTEGDPISKFCCRQCGECAPKELLEEGRFLDRISWLRHHYMEKHPGMWGKVGQLPAIIPTEPTPRLRRESDLEYIADSSEYLAQTIDTSGYRESLDKSFTEAIARLRK
jgi:hypothetical protein